MCPRNLAVDTSGRMGEELEGKEGKHKVSFAHLCHNKHTRLESEMKRVIKGLGT